MDMYVCVSVSVCIRWLAFSLHSTITKLMLRLISMCPDYESAIAARIARLWEGEGELNDHDDAHASASHNLLDRATQALFSLCVAEPIVWRKIASYLAISMWAQWCSAKRQSTHNPLLTTWTPNGQINKQTYTQKN